MGRVARWVLVGGVAVVVWWNRAALAGLVRSVGDGGLLAEVGQWWPVVFGVVAVVGVYLWDVWRRPDKPCWRCEGSGRLFGVGFLLGRRVSGLCRWCGGNRWYVRRVARWLGWSRNSGVSG